MSEEASALTCPACGSQHETGRFCSKCRARIVSLAPQPSVAPRPAASEAQPAQETSEAPTGAHCSACGALADDSAAFCAKCGVRLQATDNSQPEPSATSDADENDRKADMADRLADAGEQIERALNQRPLRPGLENHTIPINIRPRSDSLDSHNFGTSSSNDDCPVSVEYNEACVFISDQVYPFEYRIRSLSGRLKAVRITLKGLNFNGSPCTVTETWVEESYSRTLRINYTHQDKPGWFQVNVEIAVKNKDALEGDEWEIYHATESHMAFPENVERVNANGIAFTNNINLSNNEGIIRAGSLGDPGSLGGQPFARQNDWDIIRDRVKAPSQFTPLYLEPEPRPCLELRQGKKTLMIIAKEEVRFGRDSRTNTVPIRFINEYGLEDEVKSRHISRSHFSIKYKKRICTLHDGGPDPDNPGSTKLSTGTSVDGKNIAKGVPFTIHPGDKVNISLGHKLFPGGVMSLGIEAHTCPHAAFKDCKEDCRSDEITALSIRRSDDEHKAYLLLWRCSPLDRFFSGLENLRITWERDRFFLVDSNDRRKRLRPGLHFGDEAAPVYVHLSNQR